MSPRTEARRRSAFGRVAGLTVAALVASACAVAEAAPESTAPPAPVTTRVPAPPIPTTTVPTETTDVDVGETAEETIDSVVPQVPPHGTLVALTTGETDVYESRESSGAAMTLPATTILGTPTVLRVLEVTEDGWALVQLPVRPNGSTGWVEVENMDLYVVDGRIVIDLDERKLRYYVGGEEVLSSDIAIGTSRNPTPTGEFFVTDSVELGDPQSPWGPHALGLSAYSDTITEYNGGPGIIGIHGTNKPNSIGEAASLGCVRMPNELITTLYGMITIGTPVEIRA